MAAHNDLGRWGEDKAADYLEEKGYRIVARNWRHGHRDLDIVARKGTVLAIVEVKTRRNTLFGQAETAVDRNKIRQLTIAANTFVKTYMVDADIRFDIVTVVGTDNCNCNIEHIEDAFLPML